MGQIASWVSTVDAAVQSQDPRVKLATLFNTLTDGVPFLNWSTTENCPNEPLTGIKLDDSGTNVIEIVCRNVRMRGCLNNSAMQRLSDLFPKLEKLILRGHQLHGPCDLNNLPASLVALDLTRDSQFLQGGGAATGLTGAVDFSRLPAKMENLNLTNNGFSGALDWTANGIGRLSSLKILWLCSNNFTSQPDFSSLPHGLLHLSLEANNFSGCCSLQQKQLPRSITRLMLNGNPGLRFTGDLASFPRNLDADTIEKLQLFDVALVALPAAANSSSKATVFATINGKEYYQAVLRNDVETAITSHDPREKVLSLFCCVSRGLPASWTMDHAIGQWKGITLHDNGSAEHVKWIDAPGTKMEGKLNVFALQRLAALFPHLTFLNLNRHMLQGPCPLDALPPQMATIDLVRENRLEEGLVGDLTAAISKLPLMMKIFSVASNSFTGTIDWQHMSRLTAMTKFWCGSCSLSGPLDFSCLPPNITEFSVEHNKLFGRTDISKIQRATLLTRAVFQGNSGVEFFMEGSEGGDGEDTKKKKKKIELPLLASDDVSMQRLKEEVKVTILDEPPRIVPGNEVFALPLSAAAPAAANSGGEVVQALRAQVQALTLQLHHALHENAVLRAQLAQK